MKTITPGLLKTIAEGGALNCLFKITRGDDEVRALTDYNKAIIFDGTTYAPGYTRTAISSTEGLNVNRFDVEGWFDDALLGAADLRNGLYDEARVQAEFVDPLNLDHGSLLLPAGIFGQIQLETPTRYKIELSSLTQLLAQSYGQMYQATCRAQLFDRRCKLARIFSTAVVDTVITDRRKFTATATGLTPFRTNAILPVPTWNDKQLYLARQSVIFDGASEWRYVALTTGKSAKNKPDNVANVYDLVADNEVLWQAVPEDYYKYGRLVFTIGPNAGKGLDVQEYDGDDTFELFLPTNYSITPGEAFEVEPGDDKEFVTCIYKFNNALNFRGEPHVQGERKSLTSPDVVIK